MDESNASIAVGDDIKPYTIHVSSKYLELTKRKLELTRLPHEILLPRSREWEHGTPKSEIEPLIDFWLEQYSWRTQESQLNNTLPQFRAAIDVSSFLIPSRIHFTHLKSPHANALPLLLLPAFPLTNLSLDSLPAALAQPTDPQNEQPFHVVAPSIPGLGFSDAFNTVPGAGSLVLEHTANIFNSLMLKLGYEFYIASSTGSGINSPANVDYHLSRILASRHPNNCLGIHMIDPPVQAPKFSTSPFSWMKYFIARFLHAPIFGYTAMDWAALSGRKCDVEAARGSRASSRASKDIESSPAFNSSLVSRPHSSSIGLSGSSYGVTSLLGLHEPNTLAYALCDSPVGLLSLVLNGLQRISPGHAFDRMEIINLAQLAWLPGPEGAMRFLSGAEAESDRKIQWSAAPTAVTVFLGNGRDGGNSRSEYVCPAWAEMRHKVVWSKRQDGRGGLIAWERKEAIIEGIRGLAEEILKTDARLAIRRLEEGVIGDNVIVEGEALVAENDSQSDGESLDTVVPEPILA